MRLRRLIKSFLNSFLFWLNFIFWIFNIRSFGQLITGIKIGKNRREKLWYGICSIMQFLTYTLFGIGFIFTFYFWIKNLPSIAERISNLKQT